MSQSSSLGRLAAFAALLAAVPALAEPKDGDARELSKQAMDGDYLATHFKEAEQKLQKALKGCVKKQCSPAVQAELHRDLAVVYIAGLKKKDKGKKEMQAAIKADPTVQLNPDYTTPEVEKVYLAAGGVKQAEPDQAVDLEEEEDKAPPALADDEPEDSSADATSKNWLSISFQQDFLSYGETTGVCNGAAQYQCFLQGESYSAPIYEGSGNQLQAGFGLATRRVLVGYERLFGENITLGARLGFAFGGSPKATTGEGSAFLPLHAELRGSYWLGDKPFAREGVRPFVGLAAGVGEIDGHVTVEYFVDEAGYRADARGKLDAWRKTGNTMLGMHVGAAYALSKDHALVLELRLLQMLGASAFGGALNIGYELGL